MVWSLDINDSLYDNLSVGSKTIKEETWGVVISVRAFAGSAGRYSLHICATE